MPFWGGAGGARGPHRRGAAAARSTRENKSMHPDTNTMLIIIAAAVALMIVGFGLRDRNLGLGLLGIGLIAALATIAYKAYITFNSFYY
ncbi:membrane protein [Bordetella pertussis]|nr:membrane protein [Bordetella pertussis]